MSEEKSEISDVIKEPIIVNDDKNITIKKSTYNSFIKGTVIAIAIAAFFAGFALGTNIPDSTPEITKEDFKDLIQEIQKQGATAPQIVQQPTQPSPPQIIDVSLDDDPVKGDSNAALTIVEFSDFQCPFCSRFYEQTLPQLQKEYIDTGKIKLVFRDMPLSFHANAMSAAIASECANEQGKFWQYHDVLFTNQAQWQSIESGEITKTFSQYATDLGIETASFEACLGSQNIADEINKDISDAAKYGVSGTPTFFIGTEKDGFVKLVGAQPFAAFKNTIEKQLG
jgi:protein-disulfide isomerase